MRPAQCGLASLGLQRFNNWTRALNMKLTPFMIASLPLPVEVDEVLNTSQY